MKRHIAILLIATLSVGLGSSVAGAASGPAVPPVALVGSWDLITLQAAGQPVEDTTGAGLTLAFAADGRVSGSGGATSSAAPTRSRRRGSWPSRR